MEDNKHLNECDPIMKNLFKKRRNKGNRLDDRKIDNLFRAVEPTLVSQLVLQSIANQTFSSSQFLKSNSILYDYRFC